VKPITFIINRISCFLHKHRRLYFILSYALANALPSLVSMILVLIYTSAFALSEFGRYGVLTAIIGFLGIAVELGMPGGILREYYDRYRDRGAMNLLADAIHGYKFISLFVLPPAALVIYLFWPLTIYTLWHTLGIILVLLLITYFERLTEMLGSVCRAIEVPWLFVMGRAVNCTGTLVMALIVVVGLHGGVLGALLARLAGTFISCIVYHIVMAKKQGIVHGSFSWPLMKSSLSFGLPLLPNRFAIWTQQQGLKPVLAQFVPMKNVGQFSLASSIAFMPLMMTAVIDLVLTPIYFKRRVDAGEQFDVQIRKLSIVLMAGIFVMLVALILFAREAVVIIGGVRYADATPACTLLLCSAFLRAMTPFLLRQIQYSRRTWLQPVVSVPAAAIAILITVFSAGRIGLLGAAWAVVISETAMLVGLGIVVRRIERLQLPIVMLFGFFTVLLGLSGLMGFGLLPADGATGAVVRGFVLVIVAIGVYSVWIGPNKIFIRDIVTR
jgi:O-antigen/teichoic acid export membrane protein